MSSMDGCESGEERPVFSETQDQGSKPVPSCLSFKSNNSIDVPLNFKGQYPPSAKRRKHEEQDSASSEWSPEPLEGNPTTKLGSHTRKRLRPKDPMIPPDNGTELDSIFMRLEDTVISFMKEELQQMRRVLSPAYLDISESLSEEEDEVQRRSTKESCLKLTLYFLRRMKQENLADRLQSNSQAVSCQQKLKSRLKETSQRMFEGITKDRNPTHLSQIYTEQDIMEGEAGEVNCEHEVGQIEKAHRKQDIPGKKIRQEDLFQPSTAENVRIVMTKGVAGIGKSVLTQKFTLDWAEGKAHSHIQLLFPFTFRELNVLKDKKFSLVELVHHFFPETKEAGIHMFEDFKVLFIFNGLDESRLPLKFLENEPLTDPRQSTSLDVLLTNLLKGNLLRSAHIWITTRPAAANQIPPHYVNRVTEVRGFNDLQKEDYFRKRFKDKQANRIISHIETSRTLHILCHIPAFCWITATVMKEEVGITEGRQLPKTLTEMYIYFLVLQTKLKKVKYDGKGQTDFLWSSQSKSMINALGKLAFKQLLTGQLIFYEDDLNECNIDVQAASVYSGLFTQIFREQRGVSKGQVFSFIHLSFQEFLAALHVHLTFTFYGANMLKEEEPTSQKSETKTDVLAQIQFYKTAVDKALEDPNGRLDLFLRFLLGLSLQSNQILLQGLVPQTGNNALTNQETIQYIKTKMTANLPSEKSINLFHCLYELNNRSLEDDVRQYLGPGCLASDALSPAQWSALVFILLSSEERLVNFDLKKYAASEDALFRLLPVVKASETALLSGCNLSERSCQKLSVIISSQSSSLKVLDVSNNDLGDSGVELLSVGLKSPNCKLDVLRLSGCLITNKGCESLASALTSRPAPRPMRELDLRYNPLGQAGMKRLRDAVGGLQWKPDALKYAENGGEGAGNIKSSPSFQSRVEPDGAQWSTPGLKKYFCKLQLDTNTVNQYIQVSADLRTATHVEHDQPYLDDCNRFNYYPQLLCRDGLRGRCYWEVECSGMAHVAVSYGNIQRRGNRAEGFFGGSNESWSLNCSKDGFSVCHNKTEIPIASSSSSSVSRRVAVYVDFPAGTLSFYRVSSGTLIHLHTFSTSFTKPLYPGFGFGFKFYPGSSIALCSPQSNSRHAPQTGTVGCFL